MTVIVALELDNLIAPGEAARHANRAHAGFRAGRDKPHLFYARNRRANRLRQPHFQLGRGAKRRAPR